MRKPYHVPGTKTIRGHEANEWLVLVQIFTKEESPLKLERVYADSYAWTLRQHLRKVRDRQTRILASVVVGTKWLL